MIFVMHLRNTAVKNWFVTSNLQIIVIVMKLG